MDNVATNPLYTDPQQQVKNDLTFNNNVTQITDPLQLDIDDEELGKNVDEKIETAKKWFDEKYNLTERRKKTEMYLWGRQNDEKEKKGQLKDYEARSADNAIYEIEETLKALAMSNLPDTIVTPGGDDPKRQKSAKNLTLITNDEIKKDEDRNVLAIAFRHLPAGFTAVLKAMWNPEKGKFGDYEFINVPYEYVIVDNTATNRNVDKMGWIAQVVPYSVKELIMKFPKRKDKLIEALQAKGVMVDSEPSWRDMDAEVKIYEVWFDWYKRKGEKDLKNTEEMEKMSIFEPGLKWERVSGVLWMYEKIVLDKMLDPNFDHIGEEKLFMYDDPADETTKKEVTPEMVLESAITGQPIPNMKRERIYHNYFDRPHKPFYFFGYDQWGKTYLDETSRLEQNLRNQENLDDQNKVIIDQLKQRKKHIWSTDSGLDKGSIQRLDMQDNKMDVLIAGDPAKVHATVEPERPDAAQFKGLQDVRSRMYAISGSQAIRGEIAANTAATNNQIAREGNFTRSDDLVGTTINSACRWKVQWMLQFIKLRYTKEHMREILGSEGEYTYIRLRSNDVMDGMEVKIKASSTDKMKAQRNAMQTAQLGPPFTNPMDFFKDMDMNDPEGRAKRGMLFMADPAGYFTEVIMGLETTDQQAAALNGEMPQQQLAPQNRMQPQPPNPQLPTPNNTAAAPLAPPNGPPQASPRAL